jgi:hypothetical protein
VPWVKIGRYRFDLDDVALVTDVVDGDDKECDRGVTITLRTQLKFDLIGADSDIFTQAFDEHVSSRTIGRFPPPVVEGRAVYPSAPNAGKAQR